MRFVKDPYSSGSVKGKEKKIVHKLKLGIGMVGVYCIAVPLYSEDPLEIYNAAELKQRFYRRNPLMIVGFSDSLSGAELLSAEILSDIFEKQGDYDSRRFFNCGYLPEDMVDETAGEADVTDAADAADAADAVNISLGEEEA